MRKIILFSLLISSGAAMGKTLAHQWLLRKGQLDYHVNFPLKSVRGHSAEVKGKGQCDESECQFLVAAPVKSFDSGDGNRDVRMLEVTRAAKFPLVSATIRFPAKNISSLKAAQVEVMFSGESKKFENVPLTTRTEGKVTHVSGKLPVELSDFKIERPSLLGVAIDNAVPIDFDLEWSED